MDKTLDRPATGKPSMLDKLPQKSFIGARDAAVMQVSQFSMADISANPDQPRKRFEKDKLEDLAASIEKHGLMQPICLRKNPSGMGYVIVAGERRWRAFQLLKRDKISATLVDGDPEVLAIVENLQREELSPIEEAFALKKLKDHKNLPDEQLGLMVGKKRNTVSEILSITRLPDAILNDVENYPAIGKNALIELGRIDDPKAQQAQWAAMRQGRATVKDVRAAARGEKAESAMTVAEKAAKALDGLTRKITKLDQLSTEELAQLKKSQRALNKAIKAKVPASDVLDVTIDLGEEA